MRAQGTSGRRPPGPPDRELWRRSQEIEAPLDEAERLMELAAFADGHLDDDDSERIAALIVRDAEAADDVAAARALAGVATIAASQAIVARAASLVGDDAVVSGAEVIAFPTPPPVIRPWYSAVTWSGLAAAIVFAGWVGFDLGNGLSTVGSVARAPDDQSASEFFDPAPLLLRDFTDSTQI
jgi:hypothetical protein